METHEQSIHAHVHVGYKLLMLNDTAMKWSDVITRISGEADKNQKDREYSTLKPKKLLQLAKVPVSMCRMSPNNKRYESLTPSAFIYIHVHYLSISIYIVVVSIYV